MTRSCSRCNPCCCLIALGISTIIFAAVSVPGLRWMLNYQMSKRIALYNGSDTYDLWIEPTIPIHMEVYLFDLQNPEEVMAGGKPRVQEKGPYVYNEYRKKINVTHHDNGTISYRQLVWYTFNEEKSIGPENDTITTVNIPLISLVNLLHWTAGSSSIISYIFGLLPNEVFITKTVKEYLWGYTDDMLFWASTFDPERFPTTQVGVFLKKNNSDDGLYTVHDGVKDINMVGVVDKYNGESTVNFWSTPEANKIRGTDGSIGPPFISKESPVSMFMPNLYRTFDLKYKETVKSPYGPELWRYQMTKEDLESGETNPNNAGYCTPKGNCMKSGVLNTTVVSRDGEFFAPIMTSLPHFHMADKSYTDAIDGLEPDREGLTFDIDVEPTSGTFMQVDARLQVNIYIRGDTVKSIMGDVQSMVYPILWLNGTANLDEELVTRIDKFMLLPLRIAHILRFVLFAVGPLLLIIGGIGCVVYKRRQEDSKKSIEIAVDYVGVRLSGEEKDKDLEKKMNENNNVIHSQLSNIIKNLTTSRNSINAILDVNILKDKRSDEVEIIDEVNTMNTEEEFVSESDATDDVAEVSEDDIESADDLKEDVNKKNNNAMLNCDTHDTGSNYDNYTPNNVQNQDYNLNYEDENNAIKTPFLNKNDLNENPVKQNNLNDALQEPILNKPYNNEENEQLDNRNYLNV